MLQLAISTFDKVPVFSFHLMSSRYAAAVETRVMAGDGGGERPMGKAAAVESVALTAAVVGVEAAEAAAAKVAA